MKKFSISKTFYKVLFFLFIVALISAIFYFSLDYFNAKIENDVSDVDQYNSKIIYVDGVRYEPRRNLDVWLFMGIDQTKEERETYIDNSNTQSDFINLIVFDNANETYEIIPINRDTMLDIDIIAINGGFAGKINAQLTLAHTYGETEKDACENVIRAVSNYLDGQVIDNYISFTLDTVPALVDLIGGIEVDVVDDFSLVDQSIPMGENVLLNGTQALNFVQVRRDVGNSTNVERMARQKEFMLALGDKFKTIEDFDAISVYRQLSDYIYTDSSVNALSGFFDDYSKFECKKVYDIKGETKVLDTFMEFYPDEQSVDDVLLEVFYEKSKLQK